MPAYFGDDSGTDTISVRDEGTPKGHVGILDFIGKRVAAVVSGRFASITLSQFVADVATATSDGATTGVTPTDTDFVTVTSASSSNIVTLPAPTPGTVVRYRNGGTGYNLQSTAPATVAINGGTGSGVKSAIGANVLTTCVCDTATTWVCMNQSTNGTVSATAAAA